MRRAFPLVETLSAPVAPAGCGEPAVDETGSAAAPIVNGVPQLDNTPIRRPIILIQEKPPPGSIVGVHCPPVESRSPSTHQ
jgi:hypothetical protein